MMRRIILITVAMFMAIGIFAQDEQQARTILDKTATIVGNAGGASASFSMTTSKGSTSGTISIKGNKFKAQTVTATVWYDGTTQWTYMKNSNEVNVSTPTEAQQQSMNPYKFINLYKSGFNLSMKTVTAGWEIHLTATDTKRTIKELYVTIDKNYHPTEIRMLNNSNWTTIKVSDFNTQNYSDSEFQFNSKDYPQAEVIDLR
ncbi:MAG: outer-membrane lipoprotein carrier protein LolA [Prevotella sp.]|nr:outer-membrane lipoprotein carrier protein LolA [Prevotella sp.]